MKLIALSGGIASGKSTIGSMLVRLGAVHIDADQLARQAVSVDSPVLDEISIRFGIEMISADGTLDRQKLAELVFNDEDALADLNAIVHPEVKRLAQKAISSAKERNSEAIVVYEVPLLLEAGVEMGWDHIVVASAITDVRVNRLMVLRGLSESDAVRRIANQATDSDRERIADTVIRTDGTEEYTRAQVKKLWLELNQ